MTSAKKSSSSRVAIVVLVLFGLAALSVTLGPKACTAYVEETSTIVNFSGGTMGTTYEVKLRLSRFGHASEWHNTAPISVGIDQVLHTVNVQMSTYIDDSMISRFNASKSTDWFDVTNDFAACANRALAMHKASEGRFDATVNPLVNLWGFGPAGSRETAPSDSEVEAIRAKTGSQHLSVRLDPPALRKAIPELQIDLSAIAKGFGVDAVGEYLDSKGFTSWWVEIGGEVRTRGFKILETPWRVALERPSSGPTRSAQTTLPLVEMAVATSGDYRNSFEQDGIRYSHILDASTGRPVARDVAQVSVFAPNCSEADGWATTLLILGHDAGMRAALAADLPVLMLVRKGQDLQEVTSPAFDKLFPKRR